MTSKINAFLIVLLLWNAAIMAQDGLYIPRNIEQAYKKGTRSTEGKPGKNYWQNTADYDIAVDYNPATLLLKGSETISYTNNSPDMLKEIVFKLYPNLYKKGVKRLVDIEPKDVGEGMYVDTIRTATGTISTYKVDGTNMFVQIPPLLPKQKISFTVDFHYALNKGSHYRTGEVAQNAAFVAYFFPRIAVYDDIDGWNVQEYLGTQEFYNDFCNFKLSVRVPENFIVWATGDLQNCAEVLGGKYCDKITQAERADSIVTIIDTTDLRQNIAGTNAYAVWKYEATNVTDFVFALSDHYIWKSTSEVVDSTTGRRTRTDAVFNPKHKDYFDVVKYNSETVKAMSHRFPKWPFPYSHETVFDGLDQMEYPMMVNDNPLEATEDVITLTDHEVFHTMFPFYMGINETKYGWMDEGWATIGEWLISPLIDTTIDDDYGMRRYNESAGKEIDLPITTPTTQLNGTAMFLNSYVKPGLGYLYVKDLLGEELFTKALHYYIKQWNGKHPMPYDFFNCMNYASGRNLNWFWKRWFFDSGVPDLALTSVDKKRDNYYVTVQLKGNKPVPVDLNITFEDNTTTRLHKSIAVWEIGESITIISFPATKKLKQISLGSTYVPDVNKIDNTWTNKD